MKQFASAMTSAAKPHCDLAVLRETYGVTDPLTGNDGIVFTDQ